MNPNDQLPQLQMMQMISGFWVSRAIHMAATLGLADHLQAGPKDTAELADGSGTPSPASG
jgi:hypothetical protein